VRQRAAIRSATDSRSGVNGRARVQPDRLGDAPLVVEKCHDQFDGLVAMAAEFLAERRYAQAAVASQIAASHAAYNHSGAFASARLEQVLLAIGAATAPGVARPGARTDDGAIRRVLHVLSAAKDVGGDSRFVWRFILGDSGRRHSVALTQQSNHEVPRDLRDAVEATGGEVQALDSVATDVLGRARALKALSANADVVFLHVYPEDIVPLVAFSEKAQAPRIAFVVHADHQFWLGVSISDLFVHLRESGVSLSEERRGIPRERMAFLPIPLEPVTRRMARADAKKQLQLSEDTVVLLSIARAVKYAPVSGLSFPEVVEPILRTYPEAVLLAVGPSSTSDWTECHERTNGRIRALGQRSDTELFYQAADIYLDTFPFSSPTSALEAGSYGVPLVSYRPYPRECDFLGPGAPGLDATVIRAPSLEAYHQVVSGLIEDPTLRWRIGEETKQQIRHHHSGDGWRRQLQNVYAAISRMPPNEPAPPQGPMEVRTGAGDLLLSRLYAGHAPLGWVIGWYARHLPYGPRVRLLIRMLRLDRSFSFGLFLPEWLNQRLSSRMRGWRRWPGVSWWLRVRVTST